MWFSPCHTWISLPATPTPPPPPVCPTKAGIFLGVVPHNTYSLIRMSWISPSLELFSEWLLKCGNGEADLGATGTGRDGNGLDPEQRNLGFLGVWTFLGASQYERKQSQDFLCPPIAHPQHTAMPQISLKQGFPGGRWGLCRVVRSLTHVCGRAVRTIRRLKC